MKNDKKKRKRVKVVGIDGKKVKELLYEKHAKVSEFARAIGKSRAAIYNKFNGRCPFNFDEVAKIEAMTGCSINDIINDEYKKEMINNASNH